MAKDFLKDTRDHYDVIVIGSGLAGLTSANILARAGHSVLLLEHHGRAPVETLIDHLWPKETKTTRKTQALWQLAKKLRNALGWNESIVIQGKVYTLDEHATWHYDARTARHQQQAKTRFLEGIHSDWALEVARELENLQPSRQASHRPNHLN